MAIRVCLTGRVSIETDGAHVDERRFPGRQGRLLFAYLVAEQGRPVPRDALADALWNDELPATWVKALSVLVSKLRAMLEECGVDGAAITSEYGCYALTLPHGSWVDIAAAEEAIAGAEAALTRGEVAQACESSTAAIGLARRRFLPGEEGVWVEERRHQLHQLLVRAYECHADASRDGGQAAESVRSAEQIVELEPYRESGYRRLMLAQMAAGNSAEALTAYERCRRRLADDLGAFPSGEIEALYREILQAPAVRAEERPEAAAAAGSASDPARADRAVRSRRAIVVAIAAGALALVVGGLVYAARDDPAPAGTGIYGVWAAIDHDGSSQTMEITPGRDRAAYDVALEDEDAQSCGGGAVTGEGSGTAAADRLTGTIELACASGARLEFPYDLTYRAEDDTLVDPVGVIWSRK